MVSDDDPLAGVFPGSESSGSRLPQPYAASGTAPQSPTRNDLIAVFPEFTEVPEARVQFQIDLAAQAVRYAYWQDRWFNVVLLYAAHYLAVGAGASKIVNGHYDPSGGLASGVVTSKSVGGVSKSYNTSLGTTDGGGSFNLTVYGQQYLTMRESGPIAGFQL